jgi:hypothetical protein
MPGNCRTLSKAILLGLDYFLLFSTMSSIPSLDNLMAITTPSEKIIIGTKSSIGISLPYGYVKAMVKQASEQQFRYTRYGTQSTEIFIFMQLIMSLQRTNNDATLADV